MANVSESLGSLLDDTVDFARNELSELVENAKKDANIFIRHIGEMTEEFLHMWATGEITKDEFEELMEDILDLTKMQKLKATADAKARAAKTVDGLRNLVIGSLLTAIEG